MTDLNSEEIRKYIDLLEEKNKNLILTESQKISLNKDFTEWYDNATQRMIKLIKKGYYPVDVINKIAREYAKQFDYNYDAFAFARDALDRRAWEMGLRYTNKSDDDVYRDIKKHDGKITSKVTENNKKRYGEEYLDENVISSFLQRLFPTKLTNLSLNVNYVKLHNNVYNDLFSSVLRRYNLKIKSKNFTVNDIFAFLKNEKSIAESFLIELFEQKIKNKELENKIKFISLNDVIDNEEKLKALIRTVTTAMIVAVGIVSSKEELYNSLSPTKYTRGMFRREVSKPTVIPQK